MKIVIIIACGLVAAGAFLVGVLWAPIVINIMLAVCVGILACIAMWEFLEFRA